MSFPFDVASTWGAFTLGAIAVLTMMLLAWLLSLRLRDASIVDTFWGLGFVLAAWVYGCVDGLEPTPRQWLALGLVTLWGVRLSAYIGWRNHGKGEDYRYQAMRRRHGESFARRSLWRVFLLQGALILVISLPHLALQTHAGAAGWRWSDALGVSLFVMGFFFETVGDAQLARFKADPSNRGRVMRSGLWAFTRHPNYFGDAALWWGFWVLSLAVPWGLWTFPAALVMNLLLLKVSGVALLERTISERRPAYRDYIESTSAFVPWPPKRRGEELGG